MPVYTATWKLEFAAKDIEEARRLHDDAMDQMDNAPCGVWVIDGPTEARWCGPEWCAR